MRSSPGIVLGTDNAAVTFTDEADIAAYALPAVQALQRAGVINGMPDGSFCPRGSATREQACAMLCGSEGQNKTTKGRIRMDASFRLDNRKRKQKAMSDQGCGLPSR